MSIGHVSNALSSSAQSQRRETIIKIRRGAAALPVLAMLSLATMVHAEPGVALVGSGAGLIEYAALPSLATPGSAAIGNMPSADPLDTTAPLRRSSMVETDWSLPDTNTGADPLDYVPSGVAGPAAATANAVYGPIMQQTTGADGVDRGLSFGDRLDAVKWETLGLAAYLTAINLPGLLKNPSGFDFEEEGLFGKDTANLGVDKVAHAYNAYVLSDIIYARMKRKTGSSASTALASSAIAFGLDVYAEMFDAFEDRSGFSLSDVGFNVLGAGFSYLRNSVPGVRERLDFRLLLLPNRDIYSISNKKEHFRQERFLFALKLAGFPKVAQSPLRFVELHAGYYARGFTDRERARGDARERKLFVGVGINLTELLFRRSRSTISRVARTGLEYLQVPYTAVHID